jgi:hypothetical protein
LGGSRKQDLTEYQEAMLLSNVEFNRKGDRTGKADSRPTVAAA